MRVRVSDGFELEVAEHGSAVHGGTMVLVHGLPVHGGMFRWMVPGLVAGGSRCLIPDLHGFGASSRAGASYGLDSWADDLAAVVGSVGEADVTLVGYSFGGAVAMHYMHRHGGAGVKRLALLAAAGPCLAWREDNPGGAPPGSYSALAELARRDLGELNTTLDALLFHREQAADVRHAIWAMGMGAAPEAAARGIEELRDRDLRSALRSVAVPTLICQGAEDRVVPWSLGAGAQAQLLPEARVVRLEASGHGLFVEDADRVCEELLAFAAQ